MSGRTADSYFHEALGRWICKWDWSAPDSENEGRPTGDDIQARQWAWNELSDVCQSPIEQMLLAEILFINDGYGQVVWDSMPGGPYQAETETNFDCQSSILKYKVDFLFTVRVNGKERHVVVECDGHDYHERTKQQAQRDKSRDRDLANAGYIVLRFTGSEIYRRSKECAEEISDILDRLKTELVESGRG